MNQSFPPWEVNGGSTHTRAQTNENAAHIELIQRMAHGSQSISHARPEHAVCVCGSSPLDKRPLVYRRALTDHCRSTSVNVIICIQKSTDSVMCFKAVNSQTCAGLLTLHHRVAVSVAQTEKKRRIMVNDRLQNSKLNKYAKQ